MLRVILSFLICFAVFAASNAYAHDRKKVVIGTGSETGVYYAAGKIFCELFKSRDIPCEVRKSGGSIANLKALAAGDIDLAMVQSDWQFHAYRGSSKWDGEKFNTLRSVFSVYNEPFQVVVKREPVQVRWRDLRDKRVNVGNPGSGSRQTLEELTAARKWNGFFGEIHELPLNQQIEAFCAGKFDAFFFMIGIPNMDMFHAVSECNGKIIGPTNTMVRKLVTAARPYYSRTVIQGGTYWSGQPAVNTFGVLATLVTREDIHPEIIGALVDAVFDQFNGFKAAHPAFGHSLPHEMVKHGLTAPLHPAAEAYFQSKNWFEN